MRRLLADTHILLWSMRELDRIPPTVRDELNDGQVQPLFSAISIWEIAIKAKLQRPDFAIEAVKARDILLRDGWEELAFTSDHAIAAGALPLLHGDPFDRALVGQANAEAIELVTSDKALREYPGRIRLI